MNTDTYIVTANTLTKKQENDIQALVLVCSRHDGISLSYPVESGTDEAMHYLLTNQQQGIIGVLGLVFYDEGVAECSAFVHPDWRRQGYFSELLDAALEDVGEVDVLFPVDEGCADTMAVLEALGAELERREHQMELALTPEAAAQFHVVHSLCIDPGATFQENTLWKFRLINRNIMLNTGTRWVEFPVVGTCRTVLVSEGCVCLYQVEVLPDFRGRGYGTDILSLLLPRLQREGVRKIILQVTDDNAPAMALYKKTGFRITETLSYYLY